MGRTGLHKILDSTDELGTSYTDADMRHWHSVIHWAVNAGWSELQARKLEDYVWYDPQFLSQADVNPGARELTDFLLSENMRFDIITSRKPGLIGPTLSWYRKKLPNIPEEWITLWPVVEMDGGIYKAFNVNRLGVGAMFEDVPGQAKDILDYTDAFVFLLSNIGSLDGMYPGRLFRIAGTDGNPADLTFIARCL